jgi:hypothetical protein
MADVSSALGSAIAAINGGLAQPVRSATDLLGSLGVNVSKARKVSDMYNTIANRVGAGVFGSGRNWPGSTQPGKVNNDHHVLNGARSRKDPLMSYSWFCTMPSIRGFQLPWNYVEEFTAPFKTIETQSRYEQGKMMHYPGSRSVSTLSMRLYDDTSGTVGAYLDAWRDTVLGVNGIYAYPAQFKQPISVILLDVSRAVTVYQFYYIGCFPTSTDAFSLASDSNDRIVTSQEFSVDDVKVTVVKTSAPELANAIGNSNVSFPQSLMDKISGLTNMVNDARSLYQTGQVLKGMYGNF